MNYIFAGNWNEEVKGTICSWIKEKLTKMMPEPPEDLFLEYILIMIGNGKNMDEISHELRDFFGDEEAKEFSNALGMELMKFSVPLKKKVTISSKIGVSTSKSSVVTGETENMTKQGMSSSSRLLKNAIQSTTSSQVSGIKNMNDESVEKIQNKRKVILLKEEPTTEEGNITQTVISSRSQIPLTELSSKRNNKLLDNKRQVQLKSNQNNNNKNKNKKPRQETKAPEIPVGFDTEAYINQMASMAKLLGFESVEDMIALQQQQMFQLLTKQQSMVSTSTFSEETGFSRAPSRERGGRFSLRGSIRGHGRGRNLSYHAPNSITPTTLSRPSEFLNPLSSSSSVPIKLESSPSDALSFAEAPPVTTETALTSGQESIPQLSSTYHPSGYRGRGFSIRGIVGVFRGRGRFAGRFSSPGRTQPLAENKKWVRPLDMESSLVTGR